ncbi:MAG: DNA-processing protein DprA [Alphaproteobacteria bacterium]|jgi:DNA processing protein|nr:DNA-processing protein DprA [Alphaproteobacteria bacterium]MBP9867641.1 DNA-processing protein DprA [Alphaproteobacteria bacterium]
MIGEAEKIAWLRLARTETIGPITFHRLIAKYKTASKALEALPNFSRNRPITIPSVDSAAQELAKLHSLGGQMILSCDETYPLSLAAIEDAPPVLSVLGNIELLQQKSIGVVGSRNASLNGRKFAWKLAKDLSERNYVVTSGLARGIDTAAHEGALAKGTVAVVAGGVDVIYPKENETLYTQIVKAGAVISECALGMQPIAQHFPKRNRIISGLSLGIVVVEANLKSGSLITARTAGEQGRDVMAVPGFPADPRSEGSNALIRDGAALIRCADDIIEHISSFSGPCHQARASSQNTLFEPITEEYFDEAAAHDLILREVSVSPIAIDEIIRTCHLASSVVQGTLLEMELNGLVQRLPGNRVCLLQAA